MAMLKVIKQLRTIPKLGQEQRGMHYIDQQNEFYKKQNAIVELKKCARLQSSYMMIVPTWALSDLGMRDELLGSGKLTCVNRGWINWSELLGD